MVCASTGGAGELVQKHFRCLQMAAKYYSMLRFINGTALLSGRIEIP